jgi:four helix bundle protein
MAQTIPIPEAAADRDAASPFLSPERLDVYRVAVEFQGTAARIGVGRRVGAHLRDQLERASVAIVLNVAEGAGRQTLRDKAHFFTIARGSATECGAILDLLEAADHRHGRGQLIRIAQMLTRLIARASVR